MTRLIRSRRAAAFVLALAAAFVNPSPSFAAPGDFDGDGTSDLSVALVSKNTSSNTGTTAWLTRLSNGQPSLFYTWGIPADAYVTGRFYAGNNKYYPGIVWVRSAALPLEWYIKDAQNGNVFVKYGLPGDSITNLGDWDGDGVDDLSVVRVGTGDALFWYVALSASARIEVYQFGVKGDKPGVADVDGDGLAEMIVLRPGTYQWFIRKPSSTNFTTTQWGLNNDIPLLPMDLDGDHLPDFVISRRTGTLQAAYIKYGNGQTATLSLGFDTSIPQLGNFTGTPGFAWSQRDTGWTAIRNADSSLNLIRFGIPQNAIIRADGTVVQPSEDGRFPAGSSTGGGGGGSVDPGPGGSAGCSQTFSSGWLFKPAAQDTGGSRLGKPLILLTRNFPSSSCLNILANNGTIIGKYGKFSANRFYSGYGCGSMLTASQFAQRALDAAGSKNITIHDPGSGKCYGPAPADARTDRR